MTYEEALETLKERYADKSWIDILDHVQDTSVWQKAIEALEKRTPKKANADRVGLEYECPSCHSELWRYHRSTADEVGFCCVCGQAIDWEGAE